MIKITKDGRTIRTDNDYTVFRSEMYHAQNKRCSRCGWITFLTYDHSHDNSFHVHHRNGRGGGKRDDIAEECEGLCGACHHEEHNQSRSSILHWTRKGPERVNAIQGETKLYGPDHQQRGFRETEKMAA